MQVTELEHDLNWREAELASMKAVLIEAPKGSVRYRMLLRAAWALLYAHYEGFTKFAWDLYLDALERKGLLRKDVQDDLALLSLAQEFQRLKNSAPLRDIWQFCSEDYSKQMNERLTFTTRLETKSNLWPHLFIENNKRIGMVCDQLTANETKLKSLVGRRNGIAHGEKLEVRDIDEYVIYENCVFLVLHELAIAIVESLENNSYSKAGNSP